MNEHQANQQREGGPVYERCLCREALDRVREMFLPRSSTARMHLRNSRIELLKAVRSLIDDRIAYLSGAGQQGTKVNVE
ncbi:MAG TPA: hypothetical protein PLA43_10135 [Bryobacteraceae bacterium]|nr:hypothetical protein [Bryobacteraceae bacterium]HOQ46636.1 hypothetical protein [Bryobacteraceae bacterium]HPQ14575.1 hypothetical protein [Bryobacteraceae bacterium]HPU72306.1 hypothetical protein [Bryobacteraceae bacterium]